MKMETTAVSETMGQNDYFDVGFVADGYGSPVELIEVDAVIPGYGEISRWQTRYTNVSFLRNGSPECTERG